MRRWSSLTTLETRCFDVLAILVRLPAAVAPARAGIVTNFRPAIRGISFDFCEADRARRLGGGFHRRWMPEMRARRSRTTCNVDQPFDIGTTGFANTVIFGTSVAGDAARSGSWGSFSAPITAARRPMQIKKFGCDACRSMKRGKAEPCFWHRWRRLSARPGFHHAGVRESGIPFFRSPRASHAGHEGGGRFTRRRWPTRMTAKTGMGAAVQLPACGQRAGISGQARAGGDG